VRIHSAYRSIINILRIIPVIGIFHFVVLHTDHQEHCHDECCSGKLHRQQHFLPLRTFLTITSESFGNRCLCKYSSGDIADKKNQHPEDKQYWNDYVDIEGSFEAVGYLSLNKRFDQQH